MATQAQLTANRANAQKSTGPRSAEGKSIVRLNALKHGIFAECPAIIGEDTQNCDTLKQALVDRFRPATPEEEILVAALVRNAWLLERFSAVETHLWDNVLTGPAGNESHPLAVAHAAIYPQLNHLQRRIDSADRNYRRDLELLIKLQTARVKAATQPQSPELHKPKIGSVHANPANPESPTRHRVTFPILGYRTSPDDDRL